MPGNLDTSHFPFGGSRDQTQGLFHAAELPAYSLWFFSLIAATGLVLLFLVLCTRKDLYVTQTIIIHRNMTQTI